MWNPLGLAMPGMPAAGSMPGTDTGMPPGMPFGSPAALFAALDPVEIDRKIAELRVIENWLTMSVNMMQMSIKTMELQKASVAFSYGRPGPPDVESDMSPCATMPRATKSASFSLRSA